MKYTNLLGIFYLLTVFSVNGMQQTPPQFISHSRDRLPSVEYASSPSSFSQISTVSSPLPIRSSSASSSALLPLCSPRVARKPLLTTENSLYLKKMDEEPQISDEKWKKYADKLVAVVVLLYTQDKENGTTLIKRLCEVENFRGNQELWNLCRAHKIQLPEPEKIRGDVSYLEGLSLRSNKIYKMRFKYYEGKNWGNYLTKQFKLGNIDPDILTVLPPYYIIAVDRTPQSKHKKKQLCYLAGNLFILIPDYNVEEDLFEMPSQ